MSSARPRSSRFIASVGHASMQARHPSLHLFASSTGRQYSMESKEWNNGAFTKALVEGLLGQAAVGQTGRITHKMLDFYVAERVKALTKGQQTPVNTSPQGVPDFPIALVK